METQHKEGNLRMETFGGAPFPGGANADLRTDTGKPEPTAHGLVEFKKKLFGISPREVYEYIDLLNTNLDKAHEVYEEKLAQMKNSNELLSCERNNQEEKLRQLAQSCETMKEQCADLKKELESRQDMADELQRIRQESAALQARVDQCAQIENENQQLKMRVTELLANDQVREKRQTELLDEIEALRRENKATLQTSVEERTQLEAEYESKLLNFRQLLQMHRYSLGQSRELLGKLMKQFDESCEYADRMRTD